MGERLKAGEPVCERWDGPLGCREPAGRAVHRRPVLTALAMQRLTCRELPRPQAGPLWNSHRNAAPHRTVKA